MRFTVLCQSVCNTEECRDMQRCVVDTRCSRLCRGNNGAEGGVGVGWGWSRGGGWDSVKYRATLSGNLCQQVGVAHCWESCSLWNHLGAEGCAGSGHFLLYSFTPGLCQGQSEKASPGTQTCGYHNPFYSF